MFPGVKGSKILDAFQPDHGVKAQAGDLARAEQGVNESNLGPNDYLACQRPNCRMTASEAWFMGYEAGKGKS